jgi:hypothetical protein
MGNTSCTKGQLLSSEVILAMCLFLGALIAFILAWNAISSSYAREQYDRQMQVALVGISDMAVLSEGDPADWEISAQSGASAFGLASAPGVLSPQKLSALQSMNSSYDSLRERMGAGPFELYIEAGDSFGTPRYSFGRAANPLDSGVDSLSVERLALLDNSPATLKVQVWRTR